MPHDLPDFRWLSRSRARVQEILITLYETIDRPEKAQQLEQHTVERGVFGLLVGAAFSLWRAAFLSHSEVAWSKNLESSRKFLETLIRDNAIGYPQDRDHRDWTSAYYLNNARFRIRDAYSRLGVVGTPAAEGFRLLDDKGLDDQRREDSWNTLCDRWPNCYAC